MTSHTLNATMLILAVCAQGLGDKILGFHLPSNASSILLYISAMINIALFPTKAPKYLVAFFFALLAHTLITSLASTRAIDEVLVSFARFSLLLMAAFIAVSQLRYDLPRAIKKLYDVSVAVALLGIIEALLFPLTGLDLNFNRLLTEGILTDAVRMSELRLGGLIPRSTSIFPEPAHFSLFLLPSGYLAIDRLTSRSPTLPELHRLSSIVILLAFALTFSLVGYIGLVVCAITIALSGRSATPIKIFRFSIILIVPVAFLTYFGVPYKIQSLALMLIDSEVFVYTTSDLTGFAITSNLFIAINALKESYLLGWGIGSHAVSYDSYLNLFFDPSQVILELNKTDAASLYLRIPSEFGVVGVITVVWFFVRFRAKVCDANASIYGINTMAFAALIGFGIRNGSYENSLFVVLLAFYYYSSKAGRLASYPKAG